MELLSSTGKLRIYSKMSIRNYQRLWSFKDIPDSSLYLFLSFFLLEVLEQFESGKVPSKKPPKIMFKSFVKMTLKKLVELRLVVTNITGLYLQNLRNIICRSAYINPGFWFSVKSKCSLVYYLLNKTFIPEIDRINSVSYTHLTLPTILRV